MSFSFDANVSWIKYPKLIDIRCPHPLVSYQFVFGKKVCLIPYPEINIECKIDIIFNSISIDLYFVLFRICRIIFFNNVQLVVDMAVHLIISAYVISDVVLEDSLWRLGN